MSVFLAIIAEQAKGGDDTTRYRGGYVLKVRSPNGESELKGKLKGCEARLKHDGLKSGRPLSRSSPRKRGPRATIRSVHLVLDSQHKASEATSSSTAMRGNERRSEHAKAFKLIFIPP